MNKNLLTWIIGIGVTGFVGGLSTWYASRRSYHRGFNDGCRVILTIKEIDDALASKKES